ncbi:hypothetical protein VKT23_015705 [Stygiomarasmius scandens]|uniref:Uncharacterized protein n=1 Tax=Marasmiellus scandens TaxID=2682957 RepID=A0ABR1IXA7_9AGAR
MALLTAYKIFVVPRSLAHLPKVSVLALLGSYISKEPEDKRIHRLILPFANEQHPLVLVWAFGFWVIHVMDYEVGVAALRDRMWVRQLPPQDLLIWKLVGKSNLAFSVGEVWRRHSHLVNSALQGTPPFSDFVLRNASFIF